MAERPMEHFTVDGVNIFEVTDAKARQDVSQLKEDYTTILDSAYVTDTASGSIASFPDGADGVPVKSLKVAIEPVQAGTGDPSPTNIRPISGHTSAVVTRTGKNLFDPNSADKEWVRLNDTEIITQNTAKSVRVKASQGDTFTLSNSNATSSTNVLMLTFLAVDDSIISRNVIVNGMTYITQTAPANTATLLAAYYTWSAVSNAQLELSSTPTSYEPYSGQTVTIDLDGTRYGGTLDVGTGVLTVDRGYLVYDGSSDESWSKGGGTNTFYSTKNDFIKTSYYEECIICDRLKTVRSNAEFYDEWQISGYSDNGTDYPSQNWIYIKAGASILAVNDLKTWLASNPIEVVYKLATPQTIQLTAQEVTTLKGQNNIWADCGDVEVEYRADTKLYINKVLNA